MSPCRYRIVFFDVDSTLVTIEGIDVLAEGNEEIARLTDAAMNGDIPIDEVYGRRLGIIEPSESKIASLGEEYVRALLPDAAGVIEQLRESGSEIHLVTAGIEQAVLPLASALGIPHRAVHAVRLEFGDDGSYRDFDRRSPLTRQGGKELVVTDVRSRTKGKAAYIGDGVTDLEAKSAVDRFIGFGGIRIRERVAAASEIYITEPRLSAILPYLFEEPS